MPAQLSVTRHRRWIFLAALAALHLVFSQGPDTPFGRLLFLSHIGLGLLWQPFVQRQRRIGLFGSAAVVCGAGLFAYYLNWPLLIVWTMLLTGVVGGKVFLFPNRWERLFHLLALGYLALAALAVVLPQSLAVAHFADPVTVRMMLMLSPAILLVMAVLPVKPGMASERAEIVDFVYGVLVFLLLSVLVLGTLSYSLLAGAGYFESLVTALTLVAGLLLLLGFIWNPGAGFAGLGSAVTQHVMSLGLPIEQWLEALAELVRREDDPDRLLAQACTELQQRWPGVAGIAWHGIQAHGESGERRGSSTRFSHGLIEIELWTTVELSPTLRWHYDLVVRLMAEFYQDKQRAQELKRLTYVEAIHETGARLTHDVKNLLQSLDTLCLAAEREGTTPSQRFTELLRRQLPEISGRLRQTLAKLAAPGQSAPAAPQAALAWLASLEGRYAGGWVACVAEGDLSASLIADPVLFSSVAENLLQNSADKRHAAPDLHAVVRLGEVPEGLALEVEDDGPAIPGELAIQLCRQRVASANGLGIGLYQCCRQAEQAGYRLALTDNRDGCVRFRLAPASES